MSDDLMRRITLAQYYDASYPPSVWEAGASDGRNSASNGDSFTDPAITAQDATNAAKLAGLGFVADPLTAWPSGQSMAVNTSYRFYWTGTAWAAGLAPVQQSGFGAPIPVDELPPEETG